VPLSVRAGAARRAEPLSKLTYESSRAPSLIPFVKAYVVLSLVRRLSAHQLGTRFGRWSSGRVLMGEYNGLIILTVVKFPKTPTLVNLERRSVLELYSIRLSRVAVGRALAAGADGGLWSWGSAADS